VKPKTGFRSHFLVLVALSNLDRLCLAKIPICFRIRQINCGPSSCENCLMPHLLRFPAELATRLFLSRRDLLLENLALRQQLAVLSKRRPRLRFAAQDKLF